ncbi:superoxide dismutase [Mycoplasma haemofelis str. Langford 1]|uniref:Superoxide dismutase n=1 Tax=Mycoplasma haemofelis (strain Langford 1) TaxID=941640 RepID=E8ZGK7_MYCHL|nr:superoxide dismutase [Mycoplasma haemofelis]CBY92037.1 superoxide dismutase [Mycoplasma haemofelis str. Langford 1]
MFKPVPLKNSFSDYEPFVAREIMELHYSSHYIGYLNNLNKALEKCPEFFNQSVNEILSSINTVPEDIRSVVRNMGGGVSNHELLWEILSTKETNVVNGRLKSDVEKAFSSWDEFVSQFQKTVTSSFGAGWVWLVLDKGKNLKIVFTQNQDSPYMNGETPIFGLDIWEHAYYLQHQNGKLAYFKEVWKILDWQVIEDRYSSLIK